MGKIKSVGALFEGAARSANCPTLALAQHGQSSSF
jgi:hypothetical protein